MADDEIEVLLDELMSLPDGHPRIREILLILP